MSPRALRHPVRIVSIIMESCLGGQSLTRWGSLWRVRGGFVLRPQHRARLLLLLLLIVQLDGEGDGSPPDPDYVDLRLAVHLGVVQTLDRVVREDRPETEKHRSVLLCHCYTKKHNRKQKKTKRG